MGCTMSKKVTFTLDKDVVKKIPQNMKINNVVLNQALDHYLQNEQHESSTYDDKKLETKMQMLESEKVHFEKEIESLEIDNACLIQQKKHLESRIDDLVTLYPSASVLLGRKPIIEKSKTSMFKNKIFKKSK
jgi:hypothetical protein